MLDPSNRTHARLVEVALTAEAAASSIAAGLRADDGAVRRAIRDELEVRGVMVT